MTSRLSRRRGAIALISGRRWLMRRCRRTKRKGTCIWTGALYIEKVLPHWPEATKAMGGWHLLIGRDEWVTDDHAALERRLYEFAGVGGVFRFDPA